MEKRRHPRMGSNNYQIDISDGRRFFSGSLSNLSRSGLCLEGIPKKVDHTTRHLSVVLSGADVNFKILTRIRWAEEERSSKMLGLEILKAPWGWTEFVMAKEPAPDSSWAETEI